MIPSLEKYAKAESWVQDSCDGEKVSEIGPPFASVSFPEGHVEWI